MKKCIFKSLIASLSRVGLKTAEEPFNKRGLSLARSGRGKTNIKTRQMALPLFNGVIYAGCGEARRPSILSM